MSGHGHADEPGHEGHTGHSHPGEADRLSVAVLTVSTSRANEQDRGADERRGSEAQHSADERSESETQNGTNPPVDDPGGDALVAALEADGHRVVARDLVADVFGEIRTAVAEFCADERVDVVVTTGGTGVAPDDVTVGAVSRLFDTELPGFGEAFRRESYDDIGPGAIGSRATGGLVTGTPVFCLPGSVGAVELGAELILGVAPHLVEVAG